MSERDAVRFFEDLSSDPDLERDLQRALAASSDKGAALVSFAAARGYVVEADELVDQAQRAALDAPPDELSDEDLAAVAGGTGQMTSNHFQNGAQRRSQFVQTLSNMLKNQHETNGQIIGNLK